MAKVLRQEEPGSTPLPETADALVESGWRHYSKKEYYRAEADFQKALEVTPDHPDTLYALGMTQQASGRSPDAIETFEKVIRILEQADEGQKIDPVRAHMMARLARGHINRIKTGDWQLG